MDKVLFQVRLDNIQFELITILSCWNKCSICDDNKN